MPTERAIPALTPAFSGGRRSHARPLFSEAKKDPPKRVSFHYLGNQASSSKHSATMAMPLSSCASGMVTGIRKRMTL